MRCPRRRDFAGGLCRRVRSQFSSVRFCEWTPAAVVVWVGADDAINRAAKLIGRLLEAGLPIVIAIAEVHDPSTESVLRQAGALYICANEAQERLGHVLESILGPPSRSTDAKTIESTREVKMDAG